MNSRTPEVRIRLRGPATTHGKRDGGDRQQGQRRWLGNRAGAARRGSAEVQFTGRTLDATSEDQAPIGRDERTRWRQRSGQRKSRRVAHGAAAGGGGREREGGAGADHQ